MVTQRTGKIYRVMIHPIFSLALSLLLGIVFIVAAIPKIARPMEFADIIYNYRIIPNSLVNLSAILLPAAELICALLIIIDFGRLAASITLNILLLIFIAALSYNLSRGLDFQCGCFSVDAQAASAAIDLIVRDILLVMAGAVLSVSAFLRIHNHAKNKETK